MRRKGAHKAKRAGRVTQRGYVSKDHRVVGWSLGGHQARVPCWRAICAQAARGVLTTGMCSLLSGLPSRR